MEDKTVRSKKNKEIRRVIRRLIEHYGPQDSRKIIRIIAKAYNVPRQRIAGNLSASVCQLKTVKIQILIPKQRSLLLLDCAGYNARC